MLLEASGVGYSIGSRSILADVSLTVSSGEVLSIIGPNGAGKSTLLGVLAGDRTPSTGTVHIAGTPVSSWRIRDLARERAVLLQDARVAFAYSAQDVVRMGRAPWRGKPEAEHDDALVAQAMRDVDVTHLADRDVTTLSGGERGRVQLARVRAQDTPLLLLDEPTAALDIRHQESALALCRARAGEGAGAVVVLHDIDVAAAYSDRILVLAGGRVRACGAPADVCTSELLSDVYEWPIEVLTHPRTGRLMVLPDRSGLRRR